MVQDDQDFAFAVIDLLMPRMDGAELAAVLRARLPATRLILLSSVGSHARDLVPGPHFDGVMAKPVDEERLFDLLGSLLVPGSAPEQPRPVGTSAFALPATGPNLSILVVEDTVVSQKVAQHLLSRFGFRSEVAASGLEAIAALEQRDYDLVLMDVQMPDMDGLEATRLIRARWPVRPTKIVAMTANVAPEDVRRCHDAGMDDFLGKPIAVPALARILSELNDPSSPPTGRPRSRGTLLIVEDHVINQEVAKGMLANLGYGCDVAADGVEAEPDPALDLEQFAQILELAELNPDAGYLGDLIGRYVEGATAQWTMLRDAALRGDLQAAAAAAHSLRGSAAVMGGAPLARACADVEGAAGGAHPVLPAQLDRVAAELARMTAALHTQGAQASGSQEPA